MFRSKCRVLENRKVAPGHFVLRFSSKDISQNARPGQFIQILCQDSFEPLLPRPFSFLSASKTDFSVLYQVVGKGTELLSHVQKGDELMITGPLGKGFGLTDATIHPSEVYLVGGGVGIPPLFHWASELVKNKFLKKNIHVFLGARNKSLLLCESDFKKLGVNLYTATDDGSKGKKGFVTQILLQKLATHDKDAPPTIYTCGPTPMLRAVSAIAAEHNVPCEVSVEVPMACGFGACLGCAIKVKGLEQNSHRFAIACCEGPVFEGSSVLWD